MKIYNYLEEMDKSAKVVTLGNFDGVHKGHQELIKKTVSLARDKGISSCVISFYPHPRTYFQEEIKYINNISEKIENIRNLNVDSLVTIEFNNEIACLTKEEFIEEILLKKLNAAAIVVCYDFRFGKNREGNIHNLKVIAGFYGIEVVVVPPVIIEGNRVSSSLIRDFYLKGEVREAEKYLGYLPKIKGEVIPGAQLGRKLGFPTANVNYDPEQLLPGNGVYAAKVFAEGDIFYGVANIGVKPTVKKNPLVELEVHIFDFSGNIYGKIIEVEFIERIREEKKFSSLEELEKQVTDDIRRAIKICCFK